MNGLLTINVTDYNDAYAIEGANVTLYYIHQKSNEWELVSDNLKTDVSGQVRKISLYAPQFLYSQMPNEPRPYSRYVVEVSKEGYQTETIEGVQVLPCVEAIQNVILKKQTTKANLPVEYTIEDHKLYAGYEPKIIEDDTKPTPFVLNRVVVPEL